MESRLRILLLARRLAAIGLGVACLTGAAQGAEADAGAASQPQVIEPQLERRVITPVAIDTEDFEIGAYGGLISIEDFGSETVLGARVAYHISEGFFMELTYGQATAGTTSFERLTGIPLATTAQREFIYYNAAIGYNLLPGEVFIGRRYAFNTALYVIGGAGSTQFFGDQHFTYHYGVGYRFLLTDWMALHVDVRDHVFNLDVLGADKATHNVEYHGGLTFFF